MTRKIAEEVPVSSAMFWTIRASYSGDTIADRHRRGVRKPFEFRGQWYVSIGGVSMRKGHEEEEAYRLTPVGNFGGNASFYGENRPGFEGDWAENRRNQPEGFYHAMLVRRGKGPDLWVLVGPPIRFVLAADEPGPVDQEAGEPEAGLQIGFDGHAVPVRPQGNGKPVQMTFDDLLKLEAWHKA